MFRKLITRFRQIALGETAQPNALYDLEWITGRPMATISDGNGRTGYVFVKSIEAAVARYQDESDFGNKDFAMQVVTETNKILARYDSPLCDSVREINAAIITD